MKLHLEMHTNKGWRWHRDAEDPWVGIIADEGANEIISMHEFLPLIGYAGARRIADLIVWAANAESERQKLPPPPTHVVCPNADRHQGAKNDGLFIATATVQQTWIVDKVGDFVREYESCADVNSRPSIEDQDWSCAVQNCDGIGELR
jgi:hypothetical protein